MVKLVKFSLVPVVALLLMALWGQGVFAHGSVDQSNGAKNRGLERRGADGTVVIAPNMSIGQEFTPTQSTLTGVDVYLTSIPGDFDGETIIVNIRKGTITSEVLTSGFQLVRTFDQRGKLIKGFVHFDFSPIDVMPGDLYVLEVVSPPQLAAGTHAMIWSSGNKYPGGRAFWADRLPDDPNPIFFDDRDFWFRTYF